MEIIRLNLNKTQMFGELYHSITGPFRKISKINIQTKLEIVKPDYFFCSQGPVAQASRILIQTKNKQQIKAI